MSAYYVEMVAINLRDERITTPPVKVLVDTGSELSWLPKPLLLDAGIAVRGKKRFTVANGDVVERDYGYAILSAEGFSTADEVIFAEDSDLLLLGVRTLEGFCVLVDNVDHRLIARQSLAGSFVGIRD